MQNAATAATSAAAISTSAAATVAGGKGVTLQLIGWGIPADQAVGSSAAFLKDTPPDNKQVFLNQVQYARLWPQSYAWPDQRAGILKALNPVLGGQQPAHDAISAIKQQVLSTQ